MKVVDYKLIKEVIVMKKLLVFSLFSATCFLAFGQSLEGIITGVKEVTQSCGVDSGKTLQIGTADESGTLNISFTGGGYFTNSGKLIVSENGTLSISNTEKPYSPVGKLGNADIYGTIEISGGSFWSGTLINVYGNASLSGSFSMGYGSIMNVNTSTADFTGVEFRVDQGKSTTSQLNLNAENAISTMGNIKLIYWNNAGSNLKITVGDYINTIPKLRFNKYSYLNIDMLGDKQLSLKQICFDGDGKDTDYDPTQAIATIEFNNFDNDKVLIEDITGVSIENNQLKVYKDYSGSVYSYIEIIARDGEGNLIEGNWTLVEGEGGYWLNNSAIPEPAACAALLGLLSLAFAARRRRK